MLRSLSMGRLLRGWGPAHLALVGVAGESVVDRVELPLARGDLIGGGVVVGDLPGELMGGHLGAIVLPQQLTHPQGTVRSGQ